MGHSPRGGKGLPIFYGGNYPLTSRVITHTRSFDSPKRGAGAGAGGHLLRGSGSSGGMRLLRLLVLLGMGLLVLSLAYLQLATAVSAPNIAASLAGDADNLPSSSQQHQQPSAAAAAGPLAPDLAQRQLANAAKGGDQQQQQQLAASVPAQAPAGGFPAPELTHLVLVAGHAVYTGLDFAVAAQESSWFLEPYQQVEGEAQSFLDHIRLGIEAAAADPTALLLFSGGQTRKAAGPRSEGLSYWLVAEAAEWWGHQGVRGRAYTEEHARDSFENLMFSLCRFHEITGRYPARITAVSYTLKQRRFEQLHRAAVRFPAESFKFIGSPIPPAAKGAQEGEAATVAGFLRDPYGCSGSLLAKKSRRDPFAVGAPHPSRCPAMAGLLQYCGAKVYSGPVPWEDAAGKKGSSRGGSKKGSGTDAALPAQGRHSSRSGIYT